MTERQAGWYWTKPFSNMDWRCEYFDGERWLNRGMYYEPSVVGQCIPIRKGWQAVSGEGNSSMGHTVTQQRVFASGSPLGRYFLYWKMRSE